MKRTIALCLAGLLVLASLVLWAIADHIGWSTGDVVISGLALGLVGIAIYF